MDNQHKAIAIIVFLLFAIGLPMVFSAPDAPTISIIKNETKSSGTSAFVNTSGGSITTMVLNSTTQNLRWKAFVGNVSGSLTLDDASANTIFDWSLAEIVGEVYATRSSTTVSWADVNCSTQTNITNEEIAMSHTNNPSDNISTTFNQQNHPEFYVGSVNIPLNDCYSLYTYKNDTAQSSDFAEILLHDKTNVVYATIIEQNALGFNPNQTYDFQMILPENGQESWSSSTAYYFYVELT